MQVAGGLSLVFILGCIKINKVTRLVGVSYQELKRLRVPFLVRAHTEVPGELPAWSGHRREVTHGCFSFSFPPTLSEVNENRSLGEDLKNEIK